MPNNANFTDKIKPYLSYVAEAFKAMDSYNKEGTTVYGLTIMEAEDGAMSILYGPALNASGLKSWPKNYSQVAIPILTRTDHQGDIAVVVMFHDSEKSHCMPIFITAY